MKLTWLGLSKPLLNEFGHMNIQEAMENFVFPDEIDKTKLMKMNEHFFMFPKIMQKCSKLYAFSLIIDLKTSGKRPFL